MLPQSLNGLLSSLHQGAQYGHRYLLHQTQLILEGAVLYAIHLMLVDGVAELQYQGYAIMLSQFQLPLWIQFREVEGELHQVRYDVRLQAIFSYISV